MRTESSGGGASQRRAERLPGSQGSPGSPWAGGGRPGLDSDKTQEGTGGGRGRHAATGGAPVVVPAAGWPLAPCQVRGKFRGLRHQRWRWTGGAWGAFCPQTLGSSPSAPSPGWQTAACSSKERKIGDCRKEDCSGAAGRAGGDGALLGRAALGTTCTRPLAPTTQPPSNHSHPPDVVHRELAHAGAGEVGVLEVEGLVRAQKRHRAHRAVVRSCRGAAAGGKHKVSAGAGPGQVELVPLAWGLDQHPDQPPRGRWLGGWLPVTEVGQAAKTTQWLGGRPSLMAAER